MNEKEKILDKISDKESLFNKALALKEIPLLPLHLKMLEERLKDIVLKEMKTQG